MFYVNTPVYVFVFNVICLMCCVKTIERFIDFFFFVTHSNLYLQNVWNFNNHPPPYYLLSQTCQIIFVTSSPINVTNS